MSETPRPDDEYTVELSTPPATGSAPAAPSRTPAATGAPPTAPAGGPLPKRPRTPNPAVDDVIQTGEIAPRSLVVRSTASQPPLQRTEPDDTTEVVRRPIAPVRSRPRIAWLVAAVAPAIAAVVLHYARPATSAASVNAAEAESLAELAGTMFDGEARAQQVRADAIASSSMLRAGIPTDARALQDIAHEQDVVSALGAGESLEIFQGTGGARTSRLRLPADAPPIVPPSVGTARLEGRGGGLAVVVRAQVTGASGGVGGELALAAPIDLGELKQRPGAHLTGIALAGLGALVLLGGGVADPTGTPVSVPITTSVAKGPALSIVATIAAAPPRGERLLDEAADVCVGLAVLFVIVFGASILVRR